MGPSSEARLRTDTRALLHAGSDPIEGVGVMSTLGDLLAIVAAPRP